MAKIAICLSGQPRGIPLSLEQCYNNIIKPLNADVFIHSWYSKECDNLPFDSAQPQQTNRVGTWKPDSDKIILNSLNPKAFQFEPPNDFSEFNHLKNISTAVQTKIASIFYGIYKANELKKNYEKENNFKYDVVIRTRIDLLYDNPISLEKINQLDFSENQIYTPSSYQKQRQDDSYPISSGGEYSSMTDIFLIGSSSVMDKMSDTYLHFEKIHSEIYPNPYGEAYLGYNVRHKHNIKSKIFDYNMQIMHRVIRQD